MCKGWRRRVGGSKWRLLLKVGGVTLLFFGIRATAATFRSVVVVESSQLLACATRRAISKFRALDRASTPETTVPFKLVSTECKMYCVQKECVGGCSSTVHGSGGAGSTSRTFFWTAG